MPLNQYQKSTLKWFGLWVLVSVAAHAVDPVIPRFAELPSGISLIGLIGLLAAILAVGEVFAVLTHFIFARKRRPPVEGKMVGRIYRLVAVLSVLLGIAYGFGKLGTFGTFFGLFGGMLLGWSLQAPVSGIAAWVFVSLKRPFRPGDRIQFPNLGLVGDVHDTGIMYTMLNQVGGTIGSEEAVGRYILVPNAMLFGQVVINYTVLQESPYMLDEVIARITYDSNWETAEKLLVDAAHEITGDIIKATGMQPYIRSDLYDYGVYLRLRYNTRVKDRAEIAYLINKRIFEEFQDNPAVDFAIPYIYSYRAGVRMVQFPPERGKVEEIEIDLVQAGKHELDSDDIEQVAQSIAAQGLLQPLIVARGKGGTYELQAGHLRLAACKRLGWKRIPALVQEPKTGRVGEIPVIKASTST